MRLWSSWQHSLARRPLSEPLDCPGLRKPQSLRPSSYRAWSPRQDRERAPPFCAWPFFFFFFSQYSPFSSLYSSGFIEFPIPSSGGEGKYPCYPTRVQAWLSEMPECRARRPSLGGPGVVMSYCEPRAPRPSLACDSRGLNGRESGHRSAKCSMEALGQYAVLGLRRSRVRPRWCGCKSHCERTGWRP